MTLEKILSHKIIDEVRLRKHIKKYKIGDPKLWCLLLKGGSDSEYQSLIQQSFSNSEYQSLIQQSFSNSKYRSLQQRSFSDFKQDCPFKNFHHTLIIDKKILHQIQIDVKRLNPPNEIPVNSYYNILLLISHKRHKLGYVQGMADFLVPFLMNYSEAQSYFLYLDLIKKVEFNIINLQGNLILRLREELENIDPELYTHLHSLGLDFHIFSFRWFNCLFFREFGYDEYITVFTFIIAYRDINSILLYIGIGILSVLRGEILKQGYNEIVLLIQNISTRKDREVGKILEIARKLYKIRNV